MALGFDSIMPVTANSEKGFSMRKRFLVFLVTGLIFIFQGCAMAQGKLIEEIISSEKPERFKPLDVSSIVLRHIPLGSDRQAVISGLTNQGFEVKEAEKKIERCVDCESLVVFASYTIKSAIPMLSDKSYISLMFGFKQGRFIFISASHTRNVY